MKKLNILNVSLVVVMIFPIVAYASYGDLGFWSGIWHGITFPFRLFLKLIWTDIIIYEQFDSTYGYLIGYILGALIIAGGGSRY